MATTRRTNHLSGGTRHGSRRTRSPRRVTVRKLNRVLPETRRSRQAQHAGTLAVIFVASYILFVFAGLGWSELVRHVDEKGYFALQTVTVEGLEKTSRQEVLDAAGLQDIHDQQHNLLRLNLQRMSDEIAALPWVRRAYTERQLPHKLSIAIEEQVPVAVVAFEHGGAWLCNDEALIFKKVQNREGRGLPRFMDVRESEVQNALLGESADVTEMVHFLAMWKETAIQHSLKLTSIWDNERGMRIQTVDERGAEFVTIFGRDGFEEKLKRFSRLWAHLKNRSDRRPEMVFMDNRSKPNWVTVRFRDEEQ